MLTKHLLIFFLLLNAHALYAQDTMDFKLSYFVDNNASLSVEQVRTKQFSPCHSGVQNFGIDNTPHWFRLVLSPTPEQLSQNWWTKINYPPLDYIDYYLFDDKDRLVSRDYCGELRPFFKREVSDPSFIHQLVFPKAAKYTLYIRVQTEGALQVPLSIYNSKSLIQSQYTPIIIAGIYYGLFIIIVLYNGVIFLYTRDRNYLFYLLFVNSFVFWQLSLDGIGVAYLWGGFPWLVEHASILGTSIVSFAAILFTRNFLQTSQYIPRMDVLLKYFMYFCFALALAAFIAPYHTVVKIDGLLSIFGPIVLLISGLLVLKQGYRPARYYVIGWFVFLVGCILFALNKFNLIGGFYLMNHAQQIGSAVEMLMLSWALGDRIKLIQDEYLQKANELNLTLQKRIEIGLLKERHKDKMLMQQSRFAALGEMIEQIAHQWRQPLNTLALINQNLYFKYKLQKFDAKSFDEAHEQIDNNLQYMSQTIDDFRNFYNTNTKEETYELKEAIDTALSLSDSTIKYAKIKVTIQDAPDYYVHNRKNEFIQVCMNLLKNAHDALIEKRKEDREVNFGIDCHDNKIYLSVEDNAGGIDESIINKIFNPYFTTKTKDNGSGIGLYMSKSIIEEHLDGTIHVENTPKGARFTLSLPQVQRPSSRSDETKH